jgi:hypothetical protein
MTTIQIIFGTRAQGNLQILENSSLGSNIHMVEFSIGWFTFTVMICRSI